jgi:hypothetical protein
VKAAVAVSGTLHNATICDRERGRAQRFADARVGIGGKAVRGERRMCGERVIGNAAGKFAERRSSVNKHRLRVIDCIDACGCFIK